MVRYDLNLGVVATSASRADARQFRPGVQPALEPVPTATQKTLLAAYPDRPARRRCSSTNGARRTSGYGVLDVSINYNVPVFTSVRPWIKVDVFNALNNQKQIAWSTSIKATRRAPRTASGSRPAIFRTPHSGTATSNNQFPAPLAGVARWPDHALRRRRPVLIQTCRYLSPKERHARRLD